MATAETAPSRDNPPSLGSAAARFNEALAARGTLLFGSMWTFYAFFVWGLLAFVPALAQWKDIILLISSAWIQLWALPLLMVGGVVLNRASEKRAAEDHEVIRQEFDLLKSNQRQIQEELETARQTRDSMHELAKMLPDIAARLERLEALVRPAG